MTNHITALRRAREAINAVLTEDYPNPRDSRPKPCKHGTEYWQTCEQCLDEFLEAALAEIDAALAQPAAATDAGDGWQAWSTAPREPLVYILAASYDENAFEDEAIEIQVVSWDHNGWSFEHDDADEPFEPVAWMPIKPFHRRPLPAPHAQGGEDALGD